MHTDDIDIGSLNSNDINELKKEITALRNRIAVLEKGNGIGRLIPDDVKDIPQKLSATDYRTVTDGFSEVWYADRYLNIYSMGISDSYIDSGMWKEAIRRTMFPTKEYAAMYREKCQLIADMLHIKWLYDREYVPNWNWDDESERKWFVELRHSVGFFDAAFTYYVDYGVVYFSSMEKAKKCAEWLNYLYGRGNGNEN